MAHKVLNTMNFLLGLREKDVHVITIYIVIKVTYRMRCVFTYFRISFKKIV